MSGGHWYDDGSGPKRIDSQHRRCDRCDRLVTTYTIRSNPADHGPVEVVWCDDADECNRARAAALLRRPRRGIS